jgi:hypothetical protein
MENAKLLYSLKNENVRKILKEKLGIKSVFPNAALYDRFQQENEPSYFVRCVLEIPRYMSSKQEYEISSENMGSSIDDRPSIADDNSQIYLKSNDDGNSTTIVEDILCTIIKKTENIEFEDMVKYDFHI